MGAGHYSSPGEGGYDQLDLITPIRLCNIITTPTAPHPAHTHIHAYAPPPPPHTHPHTRTHTQKIKILRYVMLKTACIHSPTSVNTSNWCHGKIPLARLFQP